MAYAKMWDHSHVEEIATKAWKWDNYPIYRLRKTWADASSQLGAYKQLDNAKADADKNPGYTVFDESGNAVYTKPVDVPKPTPQPVAPAPVTPATPKHAIIGTSKVTPDVLAAFVSTNNTKFDKLISEYYSAIGTTYGIQSDVAFCQAIVETHYFLFDMGTAVKPEQHNYAGLGVTQKGEMGLSFDTIENGVRAHLQHLYAYATNSDLPNGETLLDPRFKYVERGIAPSWEDLSTRWATDGAYGDTILKVYDQLLTFSQNYTQNVEKTDAQKGVIFPLSDNSASNTLPENGIEKLDSAQKQGIFNSIVTSLKKLFGI
jgi:N-acetylmuramoyl-L-alanine amidase